MHVPKVMQQERNHHFHVEARCLITTFEGLGGLIYILRGYRDVTPHNGESNGKANGKLNGNWASRVVYYNMGVSQNSGYLFGGFPIKYGL